MTQEHDDEFRDYTRGLFGRPTLAEEAAAEAEAVTDLNAGGVASSEGTVAPQPVDSAKEYAAQLFSRARAQDGDGHGWSVRSL